MLNVALALVPAGNDDGQAMFFADPVTGAADEVIAPFIGCLLYTSDVYKRQDEDNRKPAEVQKMACLPAVSAHQADDEMGGDEKENRWLYSPGKGQMCIRDRYLGQRKQQFQVQRICSVFN